MTKSYFKSFVVLFAVLLSFSANAQRTEVSNALKLSNKLPNFRILGRTGNTYVVERYGTYERVLDVYNPYLKALYSKQITLGKDQFIAKIWLQPKFSWIISLRHDKTKSFLEVNKMDAKFNIAQKVMLLDSIAERKDLLESNLRTALSFNESKLLIYSPIFSQGKIDYFYTRVYNTEMTLINELKVKESNLLNNKFEEVMVLNDGSILFISVPNDEKNKEIYYFTYIQTDGTVRNFSYVPVQNIFKKLKFEIDNLNNHIIIAGYFEATEATKSKNTGAASFFVSKLSLPDFKNVLTEIVPITNEFYLNLTGKASDNAIPQVYTFYVNSILPKMNGGMIVLAESYFKTEETTMDPTFFPGSGIPNYNYNTIYNFNDIIAYHMDSLGNCTSQEIIRKKQVSTNDGGSYSSFCIMNLQDEIRLLFLDDIDLNAHMNQAKVKEEPISRSTTVFNLGSKNVFPVVKMSKQVSPNELLIPSYYKNKLQILKLSY